MKKISLSGISEILSEKELKNVMGGSDPGGTGGGKGGNCKVTCNDDSTHMADRCPSSQDAEVCNGKGGVKQCTGPSAECTP